MKKILFLYIIHLGFALQPIQIQACCLDNEAVLANGTAIILQSPKVTIPNHSVHQRFLRKLRFWNKELCSGSKKALYSQIAKAAER